MHDGLAGLNSACILSLCNAGGWKCKTKESAGLVPSKPFLFGLLLHLHMIFYVQMNSSYEDTSHTGSGPTHMASFYLHRLLKALLPVTDTFWGTGVRTPSYEFWGDTIHPITHPFMTSLSCLSVSPPPPRSSPKYTSCNQVSVLRLLWGTWTKTIGSD